MKAIYFKVGSAVCERLRMLRYMKIILKSLSILCVFSYTSLLVAQTTTYTVKRHDTLWWISINEYHTPLMWSYIYHSNFDEINDPNLIFPNQKLNIFKTLKDRPENPQKYLNQWYITLGIGATWLAKSNVYKTITADPFAAPGNYDSYFYKQNKVKASFFISGGHEWQRKTVFWFPNYSILLRYSYYLPNKEQGNYQLATAQPTPFTYKTQSQTLLAVGKVSLLNWHKLMPYIIGGVGVAQNFFSDYEDAPEIIWPNNEHVFPNKASFNFSYLAGLGVDYQIRKNWRLGLEYHYVDLGKGKSGENIKGTTMPISLIEQSVSLKISYYFI